MTRVDFYIVAGTTASPLIACRLAEKAYQRGHRVHIHASDPDQARQVDELLWTFRAGSFVPHRLTGRETPAAEPVPVTIGCEAGDGPGSGAEPDAAIGPDIGPGDVLINLDSSVPLFFSRFERVAEIVAGDEQARAEGRERYRFYRERGYHLDTHTLDKA